VKSVNRLACGRVFLNLGNPYPQEPRFTVMVRENYTGEFDAAFGPKWENPMVGRVVFVYGLIAE